MCLGVQSVINHTAMTVSPGCDGQVDIPRPAPPSPYPLPPSCHCPPSIKNSAPPLDYITHPAETAMTYFLFRQFGLCLFGRDERLCLSLCFSLSLRTPLPISVCLTVSLPLSASASPRISYTYGSLPPSISAFLFLCFPL